MRKKDTWLKSMLLLILAIVLIPTCIIINSAIKVWGYNQLCKHLNICLVTK